MSLETDHIVDRRRLRRKLTFWRVAAVLAAILGVVGAALMAPRSVSYAETRSAPRRLIISRARATPAP